MRVHVYRNLHRKCLSVKSAETGVIIAYVQTIALADARFRVSEAGRERVIKERRKNVHAWIEGTWLRDHRTPSIKGCRRVFYDPYRIGAFIEQGSSKPCVSSPSAFVTIYGAYIPADPPAIPSGNASSSADPLSP